MPFALRRASRSIVPSGRRSRSICYALLTAPVAFALLEADASEDGLASPTVILEAIRRNAGLIDLFCQAGQIALPAEYPPLVAYLEEVVHEVTAPTKHRVFHPKVWAIRFRSPDGESCYRLLCLSRNLTFDRSWDTILALGRACRRDARGRSRPGIGLLSKFVGSLPRLAVAAVRKPREPRLFASSQTSSSPLSSSCREVSTGFVSGPLGIRGSPGVALCGGGLDAQPPARGLSLSERQAARHGYMRPELVTCLSRAARRCDASSR